MNGFLLWAGQASQALEEDVDVAKRLAEVERLLEDSRFQVDLGIGLQERAEVALLVPGTQSAALDEAVGLVAAVPGCDEREKHPLAEHEPVRGVEVPPHAVGVDDEALHEPGEAVEHVVEREEGVWQDDA